jgi:hypothetical protein
MFLSVYIIGGIFNFSDGSSCYSDAQGDWRST